MVHKCRMLVYDVWCIFAINRVLKSWSLEKLSIAFIDRLSSNKITVLAGTSPDAAESLWSFPQSGRKPRAPNPVRIRQVRQSSPHRSRVFFVNATIIKKRSAASGSSKKKRNEFQFMTTILARVSASRIGIEQRIIKIIHCSS